MSMSKYDFVYEPMDAETIRLLNEVRDIRKRVDILVQAFVDSKTVVVGETFEKSMNELQGALMAMALAASRGEL